MTCDTYCGHVVGSVCIALLVDEHGKSDVSVDFIHVCACGRKPPDCQFSSEISVIQRISWNQLESEPRIPAGWNSEELSGVKSR